MHGPNRESPEGRIMLRDSLRPRSARDEHPPRKRRLSPSVAEQQLSISSVQFLRMAAVRSLSPISKTSGRAMLIAQIESVLIKALIAPNHRVQKVLLSLSAEI